MTFILLIVLVGLCLPEPPGILGILLHYYVFGGKEEEQREIRKWQKLDEIEEKLKTEGKTLHDEIRLAQKGKSKYFKKL
jgi:hypothetical protein